MPQTPLLHSRRSALILLAAAVTPVSSSLATELPRFTVYKDPTCGCCTGWVSHLRRNGFEAHVIDTSDLQAVKKRLAVPDELWACHTAEVSGYVIEGHVPASAQKRLLSERPAATGLAVPGMPVGSPGMEGEVPEPYDVVIFGPRERKVYMRFIGERPT